ncbi:hypothetical protein ACFVVX_32610 [Kitasatospora sp. NPDC058170]|uniref:hypothetical protein n=1 Tax=Kitasatospora sp. NPDC058170 TaxID=3346364 RepID=UPI0036DF5FFC
MTQRSTVRTARLRLITVGLGLAVALGTAGTAAAADDANGTTGPVVVGTVVVGTVGGDTGGGKTGGATGGGTGADHGGELEWNSTGS